MNDPHRNDTVQLLFKNTSHLINWFGQNWRRKRKHHTVVKTFKNGHPSTFCGQMTGSYICQEDESFKRRSNWVWFEVVIEAKQGWSTGDGQKKLLSTPQISITTRIWYHQECNGLDFASLLDVDQTLCGLQLPSNLRSDRSATLFWDHSTVSGVVQTKAMGKRDRLPMMTSNTVPPQSSSEKTTSSW